MARESAATRVQRTGTAGGGAAGKLSQERIGYLLSRIDLFETFAPSTLRQVACACSVLSLHQGQLLFEYGSSGSSLFIVVEGGLEVFRGDRVIATVARNEYIGELALFDPGVRSASVRALGSTLLVEMSRDVFEQHLGSEPEPLTAMMRTITRRLRGILDDTQAGYEQVNMLVHDMLNLLNVLSGAALVADDVARGSDNHRFLEMISQTQHRLELMMRQALSKARGTAPGYAKEAYDVAAVVRECLDSDLCLHPDLQRVETQVQVAGDLQPCFCNVVDLKRVVANLLINAAQAIPDGGHVLIAISQDQAGTRIRVSDDGPGIAPNVLPLIFDTHFTTKANGNGLGLSSAKFIVEGLHGGSLTCESTLGRGTAFTAILPIVPGESTSTASGSRRRV